MFRIFVGILSKSSTLKISFFNTVTEPSLAQFARNPLFGVPTWNPEPTFWVPTWNLEPPGTHFLGSYLEPGTHFGPICLEPGTHRNPLWPNLPGTRNPLKPIIYLKAHYLVIQIQVGSLFGFLPGTRNPPEPTLAQFAWNPEPTGTHIFEIRVGSTRNPGTHGFLGSAHADPWTEYPWIRGDTFPHHRFYGIWSPQRPSTSILFSLESNINHLFSTLTSTVVFMKEMRHDGRSKIRNCMKRKEPDHTAARRRVRINFA